MKTNDAKKEKELKTLAKDLTKDKYFRNLSITIMLFSILVISLLPAFFSMGFLLFTVPFLLLPSIFAAQMKMRGAALREEPDYKETLSIFTAYFVAPWRGVYRAFRTILFTALLWSLFSTVSGVVYLGLSTSIDPAFAAAYDVFQAKAESAANSTELMEFMMDFVASPEALNFERFTLGVASGLSGYYFIHSIGISSLTAQFHFLFDLRAQYLDNRIFFQTYRSLRSTIAPKYWKYVFFMPILYVIGFVGAYLIGSIYIPNPALLPLVGYAGAGMFFIFALPYYWNLLIALGLYFEIPASENIIWQGKKAIEQMLYTPGVPKEVAEQTKDTVATLEEILAKKKAQENEPPKDKKENGDPQK